IAAEASCSARATVMTRLHPWRKCSRCWKESESVFPTMFSTRSFMKVLSGACLFFVLIVSNLQAFDHARKEAGKDKDKEQPDNWSISGFRDVAGEREVERKLMAVPDPKLAEEHLRILTQAPHIAGSPEDKANAEYVAKKFREAGLKTEIVEYKVLINYPAEISVDVTAPSNVHMHGPTREHVDGDAYQDDSRVVMPFSGLSPSGDAEAEVVYANYATAADFQKLADMKIDLRGKIVLARYGQNFRGVKAQLAQQYGAAGLILYSDPADDGGQRGPAYPAGPWRPDTSVQRGSISYIWQFPGDVTTPGVASAPTLPD